MSNNCWGGSLYQYYRLPYQSPFVGLFCYAPCYIRLLSDLPRIVYSPLRFKRNSRYEIANTTRLHDPSYPIGVLRDDVEIHFLHYRDEGHARSSWQRRLARARFTETMLYIEFSERDLCTPALIEAFETLPFLHKVCFTARPYPSCSSVVPIAEYSNCAEVEDGVKLFATSQRHFDITAWLNAEKEGSRICRGTF